MTSPNWKISAQKRAVNFWIWISYVNFALKYDEFFQKFLAISNITKGEKFTHNFYLFFKKLLRAAVLMLFKVSKIITSFSDRYST